MTIQDVFRRAYDEVGEVLEISNEEAVLIARHSAPTLSRWVTEENTPEHLLASMRAGGALFCGKRLLIRNQYGTEDQEAAA